MNIPVFELRDRIAKARSSAGYSQEELSELIHVSRVSLNRYETGTRTPSESVVKAIAEVTNVPVEWFYITDDATPQESADPHLPPSRRLVVEWTEHGMVVVPEE